MGKRITELEETSQLSSGDFVMVDNDTVGDSKFDLGAMAENTYTKDDVDELLSQKFDAAYIAKLFGIKNLIPYPYYEQTHTKSGITWTDNGDGTITANGTATATSYFTFWRWTQGKFPNIVAGQRYVLSIEVQNGTCSVYFSHSVGATNKGEFAVRNVSDRYSEVEFTAWEDEYDGNTLALYIGSTNGQQVNTIIKPMLRLAFETDDSWMPYINPNIGNYLLEDGDGKDNVETFTSSDVADGSATEWTSVSALTTGEKHSSIFAKVSQMFKNVRYLYKMLGTTDISSIGGGTVTGSISSLNSKTTGSGTATNQYGSCTYNWTRRANVVVVTVNYTPSTNVTNSSGGFTLSNIPTPSQSVYSASVDRSTPATIYGASELNTGKTCTFYGTRVSGKTYNTSFTYIEN